MSKEDQVIGGFRDVINKMVWLNKLKMEKCLKDYKSSEVHCIDYIGKNIDPNVTKLADSFYMTRGAISKMTKKLIQKGILESYQKPDNKKEIYFKLTARGREVYDIHEGLHNEFQERDKEVFAQVTAEEFDIMIGFAKKYNQHLDVEIQKLNLDGKPKFE